VWFFVVLNPAVHTARAFFSFWLVLYLSALDLLTMDRDVPLTTA
jgi:hypothetical protein